MMFKVLNGLVAVEEDLRPQVTGGNRRSASQKKLEYVWSKSVTHRHSFFPRTTRDWNLLHPSARSALVPEDFKKALHL